MTTSSLKKASVSVSKCFICLKFLSLNNFWYIGSLPCLVISEELLTSPSVAKNCELLFEPPCVWVCTMQ